MGLVNGLCNSAEEVSSQLQFLPRSFSIIALQIERGSKHDHGSDGMHTWNNSGVNKEEC
jgi:hypothetical protein